MACSVEHESDWFLAAEAGRRLTIIFLLIALGQPLTGRIAYRERPGRVPEYTFRVVRVFPHDPHAFTQGLVFHNGFLYESAGLKGRSSLRKVRLETGEVVREVDLAPEFFGEGITILNNQILQLTWQSRTGFVYNLSDFHLSRQFSYSGEGWGLASDGHVIFMSDGTPEIRVWIQPRSPRKGALRFTMEAVECPN